MTISGRIFQLLKKQSMTQKEFSERTGISQSTISDWKRKNLNPSADKIPIICDVLKVTPYEILVGEGTGKYRELDYVAIHKDSDEYKVLNIYNQIPKESQDRLLKMMESLVEA